VKRQSFVDYLAKFLAVFLLLYAAFLVFDFEVFKQVVALASAGLLGALGVPVSLDGLVIRNGQLEYFITSSCTGLVSLAMFAGLVWATPGVRNRLAWTVASYPVFFAWNVARVASSVAAAENVVLFHNAMWVLSVAVVLGLYVAMLQAERVKLRFV
jgi:exosortase/archaeosortase family protein